MNQSINLYVVYKPEHAPGEGKFIPKAEPFKSEGQKQRIIQRARRYLDKYRAKLKVFIIYQQPGNQVVFRYPPQSGSYEKMTLWLKYKPAYATSPEGIIRISKFAASGDRLKQLTQREWMLAKASKEIDEGKLWLARIYEQPGNHTSFSWSAQRGEIYPGDALEAIRAKAEYEDILAELENWRS